MTPFFQKFHEDLIKKDKSGFTPTNFPVETPFMGVEEEGAVVSKYSRPTYQENLKGFTPTPQTVFATRGFHFLQTCIKHLSNMFNFRIPSRRRHKTTKTVLVRGFTLLELLISLAIIGLITSIVVFNQNDFSDQVSLSNVANEIDLQIREAQVYGISVKEYTPSSNEFNVAYGVSFNLITGLGGSPTSLTTFVDRSPQDGIYGTPTLACTPVSAPTPECLGKYNISRNNYISQICVIQSNGNSATCSPNVSRADITFLRPNPAARIVFYNSGGNQVNGSYGGFLGVRIELKSPKGKTQNVYVYTTGETEIR